jgi:hypothetical protein
MKEILTPRDKATLIGQVAGFKFYECPRKGDESPLLCEHGGVWYRTGFWEVPLAEEVIDDFYGEPF